MSAISLSGGGAKGDFQVGALHYLYDQGIHPTVVCSTSVGSVNGLKLCEGEGGPDQGLAGLTAIWLSLDTYSDFFAEQPWLMEDLGLIRYLRRYLTDFASLNPHSLEQSFAVNDLLRDLIPAELDAIRARLDATEALNELNQVTAEALVTFTANLMPFPIGVASTISLGVHVVDLANKLELLAETISVHSAFFNLNPTRQKAEVSLDLGRVATWAAQGNKLRMAAVGLQSGELHYVTEQGNVVNREGVGFTSGTITPAACMAEESEVLRIRDRIDDLSNIVPRTPRILIDRLRVELSAAQARLDSCLGANPPAPAPLQVGLVDAMIASSSIPTFFPPVSMGVDLYVDGGVREVIPVEMATQIKNPDQTVYAISASKADLASDSVAVRYNFATIAMRSLMEIAINEVAFSDIHFLQTLGNYDIKAIFPRVDIHTTFTLYPSFIRNRIAYGYMCSGDVISPPADPIAASRAMDIADRIAILRYGVARLECWMRGQPVPPTLVVVPVSSSEQRDAIRVTISNMKAEIGELVAERRTLGAVMPPENTEWGNTNLWTQRDEVHPWNRQGPLDDATLSNDSVPTSVMRNESLRIQISAFNSGTTTWTQADLYQLQIDPRFNATVVPLPGTTVVPGSSCVFDFTLSAPNAPIDDFVCQMARAGVRFGETSTPVRIVVTQPGEPARCRAIRTEINTLRERILVLEDSITDDPRGSARVRGAIATLRQRIATLTAEGSQLACSL